MPAAPLIIPPSLVDLARQAVAKAMAPTQAPVLIPRRVPTNVAAAVLVTVAAAWLLYQQWRDATGAPVQGPPVQRAKTLAPSDNAVRVTPAGTDLQQLGSYAGTWRPSSGSLLDWTVIATVSQYRRETENGPCTFNDSFTFEYQTYTPQAWVPYFEGETPGCGGFGLLKLMRGPRAGGGAGELIESFVGDSFIVVNAASFVSNPGAGAGAIPTTSPYVATANPDPPNVARKAAGALAPAPTRSLAVPVGAPLPRVATGGAIPVPNTAGDIGVPASAIPTQPDVAAVGSATDALKLAQTAAQAAAIAAAAAELAKQGIGGLTGAGGVALPVPGAVPQTGLETDFGGVAIGGPAVAVRATTAAIAAEVGKIEQKLEVMRRLPSVDVDPEDWLSIIKQLWDYLQGLYPAGSYQLTGPCEPRDENGNPPDPLIATWAQGSGTLGKIDSKLDAIAQLLQHHKNLRQPTCSRGARASGSGVTVHFEEV